jgi:ribonuclease HI
MTSEFNERTSTKKKWHWDEKDQTRLQQICDYVKEHSYRYMMDPNKKLFMTVDSSDYGCGGVLFQLKNEDTKELEEKLHPENICPIIFFSKAYNETTRRQPIIHKELLALIVAIQKACKYFRNKHVTIYTDHKPIIYLINGVYNETVSQKLRRYLTYLIPFNISVVYVKGELNIADPLSRTPFVFREQKEKRNEMTRK